MGGSGEAKAAVAAVETAEKAEVSMAGHYFSSVLPWAITDLAATVGDGCAPFLAAASPILDQILKPSKPQGKCKSG